MAEKNTWLEKKRKTKSLVELQPKKGKRFSRGAQSSFDFGRVRELEEKKIRVYIFILFFQFFIIIPLCVVLHFLSTKKSPLASLPSQNEWRCYFFFFWSFSTNVTYSIPSFPPLSFHRDILLFVPTIIFAHLQ